MLTGGRSGRLGVQLAPPQRLDQSPRNQCPITVPACQPLLQEILGTELYGLPNFGAESGGRGEQVVGDELSVEPGRARCRDLGFQVQARTRSERQPPRHGRELSKLGESSPRQECPLLARRVPPMNDSYGRDRPFGVAAPNGRTGWKQSFTGTPPIVSA